MTKNVASKDLYFIATFFMMLLCVAKAGAPPCPVQYTTGSIFSGHITISNQNSLIRFQPGKNNLCYNYSLPYEFKEIPNVAVAVDNFHSRHTDDLYFAIKPVREDSKSFIPFIVRTHERYTRWSKISFYFLVEDRQGIEAGYYQIDTGRLGGCEQGKQIYAYLAFRELYGIRQKIQHNLFLSGFEISTQNAGVHENSPFEIIITQSITNTTGFLISFQVTTITEVHAIHVSYVVYAQTDLSIVSGAYIYEYSAGSHISHTPSSHVGRNYARIHGISGFIINHINQEIFFDAKWTGIKFQFQFQSSLIAVQYFSYQYFFVIGSECDNCQGFPISHGGKCLSNCPEGTFLTSEQICISCGQGQYWNGTSCIKSCPKDQYLDYITNQCKCPQGTNWTGKSCISCIKGRIFNETTRSCECPSNQIWNGYQCIAKIACTQGRIWSIFTYSCECPVGTFWNGTYCYTQILCKDGKIFNTTTSECVCPVKTYWNGRYCEQTKCIGGQYWKDYQCVCPGRLNFNGTYCIQCINGQYWDQTKKNCVCENGYFWNGNFCEKRNTCTGGRKWSVIYKQCICEDQQYWNGAQCVIKPICCCGKKWDQKLQQCECDRGFNWDGRTCVQCMNGKNWDESTQTCICQEGTRWNGQFCIVVQKCYGGMMWNQNTWSCQCPSTTVWNNQFCVANPCYNGQIWDQQLRKCICTSGKVFINGSCLPPELQCTGGRYWDSDLYACKCPSDFWFDGNSCIPINKCKANQIYYPINNKCQCPTGLIWLQAKNSCGDPTCPVGKMWDGNGCIEISCPPNSYYNGTECVCFAIRDKCKPWQYFDGISCKYYLNKCPEDTQWRDNECKPIGKLCPDGHYKQNNICKPFPQLCPSPCQFQASYSQCKCPHNSCPPGTYSLNSTTCVPYKKCPAPQVFSQDYLQCICPNQTLYSYNGQQCLNCPQNKIWVETSQGGKSCQCPPNYFEVGKRCEPIDTENRCKNIPNSHWDLSENRCVCRNGFTVIGLQCICLGVVMGDKCQRCAEKPNSQWKFGMCQCQNGYFQDRGKCVKRGTNWGNDSKDSCAIGTYFDSQQKKCLACPHGCLSCNDCYSCQQCRYQFNIDRSSRLCTQHCGDGKKFVLQCDDGNNINGDGCSMDCKIEQGYTCRGGSPNSADFCLVYEPQYVTIVQTGQIRYSQTIMLNINIDYMPRALQQSVQCQDRCSNVINGKILSGDKGAVSIKSTFIPGTAYSFSVEINFGRSYIGQFKIQISINPAISQKYYRKVSTNKNLIIDVNPAYLAKANDKEDSII